MVSCCDRTQRQSNQWCCGIRHSRSGNSPCVIRIRGPVKVLWHPMQSVGRLPWASNCSYCWRETARSLRWHACRSADSAHRWHDRILHSTNRLSSDRFRSAWQTHPGAARVVGFNEVIGVARIALRRCSLENIIAVAGGASNRRVRARQCVSRISEVVELGIEPAIV